METDRIAAFWLAQIVGIGPVGKRILEGMFGDIRSLFFASAEEVITTVKKRSVFHPGGEPDPSETKQKTRYYYIEEKNNNNTRTGYEKAGRKHPYRIPVDVVHKLADPVCKTRILEEYVRVRKKSIAFVIKSDPDYPERLLSIPEPPEQLFVIGRLPRPDQKSIGIVGARDCTPYGRDMSRLFGYRLAQAGMAVISGLARGVDGWAHRGALEAGGDTYAVLGSGVEVCYPKSNEKLYRQIAETGGILSEYPTTYGALAVNFPLRNRIISGLSDGILVVEARIRSGSLITADTALDQGRDVFVIPGRIGDELSIGCNRLIRQGAIPVLSPEDILEYYHIERPKPSQGFSAEEQQIYERVGTEPVSLLTLASSAQGAYANTLRIVRKLEKAGYIRESSRDHFVRV